MYYSKDRFMNDRQKTAFDGKVVKGHCSRLKDKELYPNKCKANVPYSRPPH